MTPKYEIKAKNVIVAVYENYFVHEATVGDANISYDKSYTDVDEFQLKGKKIILLGAKSNFKRKIKIDKSEIHQAQFLCDYANEAIKATRAKQRENWDKISAYAYKKDDAKLICSMQGKKYQIEFYETYVKIFDSSYEKKIFYIDIDFISYSGVCDIPMFSNTMIFKALQDKNPMFCGMLAEDAENAKQMIEDMRKIVLKVKLGEI